MTIHKTTAFECNRCLVREEDPKTQEAWTHLKVRIYGMDRGAHLCAECSDALVQFMFSGRRAWA